MALLRDTLLYIRCVSGGRYFMSINDYFIVDVDYGTSGQRLKEITLPTFPNDYLDLCDTHTQTYA